jgi:prepilin-type N-terminal cleavage/methylation domain
MCLSKQTSQGLTLIEVLICVALLAVAALSVAHAFNQYNKANAFTMDLLNNTQYSSKIMDRIAGEIRYATKLIPPSDSDKKTLNFIDGEGNSRKYFVNGNNLYFYNGLSNVLIAGNVKDIQYTIDNLDSKTVIIQLTMMSGFKNYLLKTTVRLLNGSEG